MWEYTKDVKKHFLNPKNVGKLDDANGIGEVGSLACGDALKLYIKVDNDERITDAKFQTFGCASAIASSSALTEIIKGLSIEEAQKISNDDIANFLGGLPREKMHCSVMGREALEEAIKDYKGEAKKTDKGNIVCECFGITDRQIKEVVKENNLKTIEDVTSYIKAGGGCGNCHENIEEIINDIMGKTKSLKEKKEKLTNIQIIRLIEETLEREIIPALKKDGGDLELVDVDRNKVIVRLGGSCATCKLSEITLKDYVETKLRELVSKDLVVEEIKS